MWSEDQFAEARAWAAVADVLRLDDKHHLFGPSARHALEESELWMRAKVFGVHSEADERQRGLEAERKLWEAARKREAEIDEMLQWWREWKAKREGK